MPIGSYTFNLKLHREPLDNIRYIDGDRDIHNPSITDGFAGGNTTPIGILGIKRRDFSHTSNFLVVGEWGRWPVWEWVVGSWGLGKRKWTKRKR